MFCFSFVYLLRQYKFRLISSIRLKFLHREATFLSRLLLSMLRKFDELELALNLMKIKNKKKKRKNKNNRERRNEWMNEEGEGGRNKEKEGREIRKDNNRRGGENKEKEEEESSHSEYRYIQCHTRYCALVTWSNTLSIHSTETHAYKRRYCITSHDDQAIVLSI